MAALFSAFFAAHGLVMTGQFLDDEIRAGTVESVLDPGKAGRRLRLEDGRVVVFTGQVLLLQPRPVRLSAGDRVEKRRDSLVYARQRGGAD